MKKLVLKKDVIARINGDQMNQLRGGVGTYGGTSDWICPSDECTRYVTCENSCQGPTCNEATCNNQNTCGWSCNGTCATCEGKNTCDYTCTLSGY